MHERFALASLASWLLPRAFLAATTTENVKGFFAISLKLGVLYLPLMDRIPYSFVIP